MIGIRINRAIGIGDAIQFTSVPENYFRYFGKKLADIEHHWVLDHNPYVLRNIQKVDEEFNLWHEHCYHSKRKGPNRSVLLSNAESHASIFGYPVVMNRPNLYWHENVPYSHRQLILLHVKGKSHGQMPRHVVAHVIDKYGGDNLRLVGLEDEWIYDLPKPKYYRCSDIWELVALISRCRMFIGVDSGPSWIAQCYPDVITKKIRLIPKIDELKNHVPLEWCRLNSHWDDRSAFIYNQSEDDVGFTWSYRRI